MFVAFDMASTVEISTNSSRLAFLLLEMASRDAIQKSQLRFGSLFAASSQ
jgi:hypothetical protein